MTFEQAIRSKMGLTFPVIAPDGLMKVFKINGKPSGFAINLGDCGAFGDFDQSMCWAWDGVSASSFVIPSHESAERLTDPEIAFEWLVIGCARGLIERGDALDDYDLSRYALAIKRTGGLHV